MAITQLGEAYVEITAKDSGLAQSLNKAKGQVDSSVSSMSQKLAGIGKGMTVAGGVISAAVIGTFKSFADYETKLTDMAKVTGESFESIEEKISGINPILGNSTELMSGYYQVISAGIKDPVEALNTLTVAAQTAKAAHVEQSEVVKAITKLMAGYEGEILSTSEAADLLFSIEKEGQTTVGELVPVIGGLAKNSHEVGVSQNEMAAAMATITKTAGSTAEATTQYEAVLTGLMKPTGQMKEAFKGIGEEIRGIGKGYESAEEMIKDLGLVESLKKLEEYTGGSSQALAELFGRKEALVGFSALSAESFQTLNNTIVEVGKGAGSAKIAFEDWSETSEAKMAELKNTFTNFSNDVGKILAPMIKELLENISGVIKKISEWAEANPKLMETIVTLGAKIGAIAAVGGPILLAVSAFMKVKGAMSLLGTVASGPIGILILAIVGVYEAWKNWDKIVEFVSGFVKKIITFLTDLKEKAIKKVTEMIDSVIKKFEDIAKLPAKALQWGKDIIIDFANGIKNTISKVTNAVGDIIGEFKDIVNLPAKALEWGKNAITGFVDGIKSKLSSVTDAVNGVANKIKGFLGFESPPKEGPLSTSDRWMPNMMSMFGEGITDNLDSVYQPANTLATGFMNIFTELKTDFKNNIITPIIGYLENQLTNAIVGLLDNTSDFEWSWKNFWDGLKNILIQAVAAMIAKLIVLASFSWLFGMLGLPLAWIGLDKGGVVGYKTGGKVKGFAPGGGTDTVPAMLTPGEYVISRPMVDFIKRTGTVTGNLIDAIRTGARTPVASFAGGGSVSNPISNIVNINAGAIVINTPKFNESDGQRMFQIIERQAKMRGLKLVTA